MGTIDLLVPNFFLYIVRFGLFPYNDIDKPSIQLKFIIMKKRNKILLMFFTMILLVAFFTTPGKIQAQSESAYDLISTVNALRASKGLNPYKIDSSLMSYAQQHAEYMASIQSGTHTHSDGSISWESGIQENVASGTEGIITVNFVVYQIWSDWVHWHIMVDYSDGDVGAGMALGADGQVYYSLNVRPASTTIISNSTNTTGSLTTTIPGTTTTPSDLISPLMKSTPAADGSITHVVDFGQSLWSIAIAYGVKMDDIRRLNNLAMDSIVINVGQELLIFPPFDNTVTPTLTQAPVERQITATKSPTSTTTIIPILTPSITPTSVPINETIPKKNKFPYILLTISLIGLLFATFFGTKKPELENKSDG